MPPRSLKPGASTVTRLPAPTHPSCARMRRWHIEDRPTTLQLNEIAQLLREGSVILLPTDTIYGLHARALDEKAVERIRELKGRENTKPFIVLASSMDDLQQLG